ncbi:Asp-tRNA(Asn)/Glu-tRNA(Gln) amidotransferase subunit GatC [Candidatus Dojkabacteria bacterium]|nr:Asp-tRNA(Asn)/Glu-tRNA(Gln) amidotransferase subunit GatC [Candidatus Dojkabacteria bacterium]
MAYGNCALTKEDVKDIADLIKIYIHEEQLDDFRAQLDTALDATEVFDELDLEGAEETSSSIGTINIFRDDVTGDSLMQEEALQNAAFVQDGFVVVQRVVQK